MKEPIRLLDLGPVPPIRSQTIYHAVAYAMTAASPDTIILVAPTRPYVCIGYHQDLDREVDLDYCRGRDLPVTRREVGGGAVYLDDGQLFSQWVFRHASLPASLEERFSLYIRPLVETYRALGVPAYHRPVNDIHVEGKKIGGTGAAQIGEAEVLVGSLMFTFDKRAMARVLKLASEKMRDKVFESLEQYMTTLGEQVQPTPDRKAVQSLYLCQVAAALGREIRPGEPTAAELGLAEQLDERFVSEAWLHRTGGRHRAQVKIHQDVQVAEGAFKAPGGLIRVTVRLREGRIDDLALSGDFTLLPVFAMEELQAAARDTVLAHAALTARFTETYRRLAVQSPGVTPEHLAEAILSATAASEP